jgi:hypothetical protein
LNVDPARVDAVDADPLRGEQGEDVHDVAAAVRVKLTGISRSIASRCAERTGEEGGRRVARPLAGVSAHTGTRSKVTSEARGAR